MLPHSSKTTGNVLCSAEGCILVEFCHKKKRSILFVIPSDPSEYLLCTEWQKPGKKKINPKLDNPRPNSTRLYMETILKNGWQVLPLASYGPYLDLSRPNILWVRKYKNQGQHYATNTTVYLLTKSWKEVLPQGNFQTSGSLANFTDLGGEFLQNWIQGGDLTDTWCFLFIPLLDCENNMLKWRGPLTWLIDARIATQWICVPSEGLSNFVTRTSLTLNKSSLTLWANFLSRLSCARSTIILWLPYRCALKK
jgi:hypothetical protein